MHQSKKKNLENFRRVEQKEHYEVHVSETNPQVEVEVYRLDYVKKKDRQVYEHRLLDQNPSFPKILRVDYPEATNLIYTEVIMERTPIRLEECADIQSFPHRDLGAIVMDALLGFESLFLKFGAFRVRANMMGFDREGNLKVWINRNFAKNHFNPFDISVSDSQTLMVRNIYEVFQGYNYHNEELKSSETFDDAKHSLGRSHQENSLHNTSPLRWQPLSVSPVSTILLEQNVATGEQKARELVPQQGDVFEYNDRSQLHQIRVKVNSRDEDKNLMGSFQREDIASNERKSKFGSGRSSLSETLGDDFLVIKKRSPDAIPTFSDEESVREFLGSSVGMIENKLLFITKLKHKSLNSIVKELITIFEYAITKDSSLYEILLKHRGHLDSITDSVSKEKVAKIKQVMFPSSSFKEYRSPPIRGRQEDINRRLTMAEHNHQELDELKSLPINKNEYYAAFHAPLTKALTTKYRLPRPNATKSDLIDTPQQRILASHQHHPSHPECFDSHSTRSKLSKNEELQPIPQVYEKKVYKQPKQSNTVVGNMVGNLVGNVGTNMYSESPRRKDLVHLQDQFFKVLGK